ncbi:hypothetical protein XbC2_387 [Xanthomonas phage XbC2]|nr:hypothetical protein XbC2_387 [Xanthomonas phage XbC2]
MTNFIEQYFECSENLAYELTERCKTESGVQMVEIDLTFLYNKCWNFRYFPGSDFLLVEDWMGTKRRYKYPNFSRLADEAWHFQKMTQWDHLFFESTDVVKFMEVLNGIKDK